MPVTWHAPPRRTLRLASRDRIVWPDSVIGARWIREDAQVLERFLSIDTRQAVDTREQILEFAERYGPLRLCEKHALPVSHRDSCEPKRARGQESEPVAGWVALVELSRAFVEAAGQVRSGVRVADGPRETIWRAAMKFYEISPTWIFRSVKRDREQLADFASEMLVPLAGLRPGLVWDDAAPRLELTAPPATTSVFTAMAVQLLRAMAKTRPPEICSSCGVAFKPLRKPNPNRRRYCDACRTAGKPTADAKAAWRLRQIEGAAKGAKSAKPVRTRPRG
jgi:hypothetical protein